MRYSSHYISYSISFALWPLYVSGSLILNSLFTSSTSSSSCSSQRVMLVAGVSDLALPNMLPEGLRALRCGLNPDIVVFPIYTRTVKGSRCLKCNVPAPDVGFIGVDGRSVNRN
jgi:hypothetical protein